MTALNKQLKKRNGNKKEKRKGEVEIKTVYARAELEI
jgi:hypothetical protein